MGIRTNIKRKILEWSIDSITESFYSYVKNNPDCRLTHVSSNVLPDNFGKQSRLFASHVMNALVENERVIKYNRLGCRYPQFVINE